MKTMHCFLRLTRIAMPSLIRTRVHVYVMFLAQLTPVPVLREQHAFKWVQKYINLFGGDPSKVTLMGESAGGGSIMHHITAPSTPPGQRPFIQAIVQSPAIVPLPRAEEQEATFQAFL